MMSKGLIWATAEDVAMNRGRVLSIYRRILRSLNSADLPLTYAARLAKKAEVRGIFMLASEERSLDNISGLIDAAEYSLSLIRRGEIPKHIHLVLFKVDENLKLSDHTPNASTSETTLIVSVVDGNVSGC